MDMGLNMMMGVSPRAGSGGGGAPEPDPIEDDFSGDLSKWSLEPHAGSITIVSGRMRMVSQSNAYATAYYDAVRIPEGWATIAISFKVNQSSASNNDFSAGICVDDPATGEPNSFGSAVGVMQNGYSCLFRASTFTDRVTRFNGGGAANLRDSNEVTPSVDGTQKVCTITFTNTGTSVTVDRTYDGVAVGAQVVDSDANRKTGACNVFLAAYANAQLTEFDDFEVTWS